MVSDKPSPRVAIVVLNWNNASDTLDCLNSLERSDYPNSFSLVVDNGSTDDSVALISQRYPDVEIIANRQNLGYAAGNNIGIEHALRQGSDYVLVLNNDTLVHPQMLSALVEVAESNPTLGICGPTIVCADAEDILFAAGGVIRWAKGLTCHRGMFEPLAAYAHLQAPQAVDFLSGCALLVRRQLIEQVGMLNRSYYLNYEDVEWCVRAWRHGYEVWYVPTAVIGHRISATLGRSSPANTYYMTRNALLFFGQNAPAHLRWLAVMRIVGRTLRTLCAWTLKSQYQTDVYRRNRAANLFALRDFFLGRFGKMGADISSRCYVCR